MKCRVRRVDRIGEEFVNNQGHKFKIVEYNNTSNVIIEFIDEYKYRKKTTYRTCISGEIKNPYGKDVCGVGCLGLTTSKVNGKHKREYTLWNSIIHRCYEEGRCESYKGCYVCDRWLCFEYFEKDICKIEGYEIWFNNPNKGISLDKDIKIKGNRCYCLDACCFVSREDNTNEMVKRRNDNQDLAREVIGVNVKDGSILEFQSISKAGQYFGKRHTNIQNALNPNMPHSKTAYGYYWFYKDEYKGEC